MSLSHALLGFLSYAPMTGYDINKILDDSVNFFWTAQTSQIYRELKALEQAGCIETVVEDGERGPSKHICHITEDGRARLKKWIAEGHTDETIRNEFMIWLLFCSQIDREELVFQLQKKCREYRREYEMLQTVEQKVQGYADLFDKQDEMFYWKLVLKRGFYDAEAKLRWAEDVISSMRTEER